MKANRTTNHDSELNRLLIHPFPCYSIRPHLKQVQLELPNVISHKFARNWLFERGSTVQITPVHPRSSGRPILSLNVYLLIIIAIVCMYVRAELWRSCQCPCVSHPRTLWAVWPAARPILRRHPHTFCNDWMNTYRMNRTRFKLYTLKRLIIHMW